MRVSILIPCHNAKRWVATAIESALAQTWLDKEVVVVDDGSTDGSLEEIQKFDGLIRWETGPKRGGNAARNRLLELATGDWLQYLDADDYLLQDKITKQMGVVALEPEADVIFGPVTMEYWTETGTRRESAPIPQPHDPWILLARWFLRQTGSVLSRRKAILDVGGWKLDQLCCQEHELYLRLLMARKRFVYSPTDGAIYRQWCDASVSKRDISQVHRRRIEIELLAEDFLRENNELSPQRLRAINEARFEIARMAWLYDPHFASEIVAVMRQSDPAFTPREIPSAYRAVYRILGFQTAERIANWKRTFMGISGLSESRQANSRSVS